MIDFVKFRVHDSSALESHVVYNNVVDLHTTVNIATGEEFKYPKRGLYENIELSIHEKSAYVKGSVHKMVNRIAYDADQNYNSFSFKCASEGVQHLIDLLKIKHRGTTLTNLELGFNIPLSISPSQFLKYHVLMYDYTEPSKNLKHKGRGDYKEFQKTDYYIKIYSKSKQYNLNYNLLRVELKILSKRLLEKLGVFSLEDLQDRKVIKNVFNLLWKELQNVMIVDDYTTTLMSPEDRSCLSHYTNPNYWNLLARDASYKVRNTKKKELQKLLEKFRLNTLRNEIFDKMECLYNELIKSPCNELKMAA
ncbi:MAG: hypothetical protein EOO43_02530 [Flavobacterium sp.]|nr:MAG: hypothetical protein EOO43_02530 [Flavobacterium sp.]